MRYERTGIVGQYQFAIDHWQTDVAESIVTQLQGRESDGSELNEIITSQSMIKSNTKLNPEGEK